MKCINDFIVTIENPFKDKIQTQSGVELYVDKRYSQKTSANTIVIVDEVPLDNKTNIKKGDKIFIDPTVLIRMVYMKTGEHDSRFKISKDKYKVPQNLVIAKFNNDWECVNEYVLCKQVEEQQGDIINPLKKFKTNQHEVVFTNEEINVSAGDLVWTTDMGIDVELEGKPYKWFRNKDIIAK